MNFLGVPEISGCFSSILQVPRGFRVVPAVSEVFLGSSMEFLERSEAMRLQGVFRGAT